MGTLLVQNKSACHHLVTFAPVVAMKSDMYAPDEVKISTNYS